MASHRRTAFAALAVVLASLSLYAVFIGSLWFWAGCGAIIVVALTGTVTRLRSLPVPITFLAYLVTLFLYLNLAFSNTRSFAHLLPTPASVVSLFHTAGDGFNEASRYAPPVPGLRGMVLLAAAGIGFTALLTDLMAVRLESAAIGGLPLLLLVVEPFTLSVSRGWLGTTITFAVAVAGYLALLSSEARDKIREWEHPDPTGREPGPDTRPLAAAGRRVGFASVVLALALPLVIPGVHVTRLFGGQPGIGGKASHGGGSGGSGKGVEGFPSPNLQLTQELDLAKNSTVLVYQSTDPQPGYLPIYTLNNLTGNGWQLDNPPQSLVSVNPKMPSPPGLTTTAGVTTATTKILVADSVGQDTDDALPVPYPATSVIAAKGSPQADRSTLMVFDHGVTLGGLQYTVTSDDESPSPNALNDAPPVPSDIMSRYTEVPASYDALRATAQSIAAQAGATTPFEKAVALENWFAFGDFTYTLRAQSVLNAAELKNFLATKQGYCQQFSFAMAVFARMLNIPARVAYGFTAGTSAGVNDQWVVTAHDAHAWPELYFQGYGWLRFEPTPPGGAIGQATASQPGYATDPVPGSTAAATPQPTAAGNTGTSTLPPDVRKLEQQLDTGGVGQGNYDGTGVRPPAGVGPWEVLGLVVAGLVLLMLLAPWCARLVIRRRRWRHRHGDPDTPGARDVAWAHAAWLELRDDLVDYGAGYQPSESPRAVAARAGAGLTLTPPAQTALGRIALAEERARYAPAPTDGSLLRADSAAVRRAIAASVPRGARWRARLLPPSVVGPALTALAAAGSNRGQHWWDRFRSRAS